MAAAATMLPGQHEETGTRHELLVNISYFARVRARPMQSSRNRFEVLGVCAQPESLGDNQDDQPRQLQRPVPPFLLRRKVKWNPAQDETLSKMGIGWRWLPALLGKHLDLANFKNQSAFGLRFSFLNTQFACQAA